MKNVLIFGASGHGSVVLDCIEQEGIYNVMGFIDSFKKIGTLLNGYQVLGSEKVLPEIIDKFNIYGIIIAIGDNWRRKLLVDKIREIAPDLKFIRAIHPSATVGKDVTIGEGTVIMPGTIVNANCTIGTHCILNTNSSLDHDSVMENFSSLAPRVCTGGNLLLRSFSAICLGANVIEGITIDTHTVIGAGSLVIKDIESRVLAFGNPAEVVRERKIGERYLTGSKFPSSLEITGMNT